MRHFTFELLPTEPCSLSIIIHSNHKPDRFFTFSCFLPTFFSFSTEPVPHMLDSSRTHFFYNSAIILCKDNSEDSIYLIQDLEWMIESKVFVYDLI